MAQKRGTKVQMIGHTVGASGRPAKTNGPFGAPANRGAKAVSGKAVAKAAAKG